MSFRENKELLRFCRFALVSLLISLAAYQLLISNELVNTYDALWNGAEYRNYQWVIEIGRWFWPAVGVAQMNICPEPFTSILALVCYVLGSCTVAFWFDVKDSLKGYLLVLTSVINTAVCVSLSYRYTSPTFGMAYLLSVLAAWMLSREKLLPWLASVACLTLALGLYQSNIGCACVLVLIYVIRMQQDGTNSGKIFRFVGRTAAYALKDKKNVLKVFIHAPINYRETRAVTEYGVCRTEVTEVIRKADKRRAAYYRQNFGKEWRDYVDYDLVLDSSILGLDKCAAVIAECAK